MARVGVYGFGWVWKIASEDISTQKISRWLHTEGGIKREGTERQRDREKRITAKEIHRAVGDGLAFPQAQCLQYLAGPVL